MTTNSPICSLERFDVIREQNPELRLNIYAMEPGGPVTLEVITPDDGVFSFTAPTAAAAIAKAFPEPDAEPDTTDYPDVFS